MYGRQLFFLSLYINRIKFVCLFGRLLLLGNATNRNNLYMDRSGIFMGRFTKNKISKIFTRACAGEFRRFLKKYEKYLKVRYRPEFKSHIIYKIGYLHF